MRVLHRHRLDENDVDRWVECALAFVPPEDLRGIDRLELVDSGEAAGRYFPRGAKRAPYIEIAVGEIGGEEQSPLLREIRMQAELAQVLFHEIGHHVHHKRHGVSKRKREAFAEAYAAELFRKLLASKREWKSAWPAIKLALINEKII